MVELLYMIDYQTCIKLLSEISYGIYRLVNDKIYYDIIIIRVRLTDPTRLALLQLRKLFD